MFHVARLGDENDLLSDIRRMIRDALEILRDENYVHFARRRLGMVFEFLQDISNDFVLLVVDGVVFIEDEPRQIRIPASKGVERAT